MSTKQLLPVIKSDSNEIMEEQLRKRAKALESELKGDLLFFNGPITTPSDDLIKGAIESENNKFDKLIFILETQGGYIETAKRIVEVTRHHYKKVDFIIPNCAMSAGTILVMSGDKIYMNYYSVLGPIDPQVERPGGARGLIPALGYLIQYERLIEKSKKGKLTTAEMAFLIEKFDPAELYKYEQERELSISLLKDWLVEYRFRKKKKVTPAITKKAAGIAKILNDTDRWYSHSCGISMDVLKRDLGLKIDDFEDYDNLKDKIGNYYKLVSDYSSKRGHDVVLHFKKSYFGVNLR